VNDPVRTSYVIRGIERATLFAEMMDIERFPEWSFGLKRAWIPGEHTSLVPGASLGFELNAVGMTHQVISEITVVEAPSRIAWRYTSGAVGIGGWTLEEASPHVVRLTLFTDYEVEPAWLNKIAHKPFFRAVTEDLLRRSVRRLEKKLKTD
jgi:ribosome-associated toxin RatA of RatAB toxin-antitoxin module